MTLTPLTRACAPFILSAALAAGQGAPAPKAGQAAATEAPNPAMKSRLILLQHASPDRLRELLRPMLSNAQGATLDAMDRDGIRALSVRDFPENLAAVEEAVKRLDAEPPLRKQVEFHIHVLFASKDGQGGTVPEELQDVLASLRSTLAFRSYTPIASFVQRAADGADAVEGDGQAEMAVRTAKGETVMQPMDIQWGIYHLSVAGSGGSAEISFPKFQLGAWEHLGTAHGSRLASLETNLTMKNGEKVVVGTSMIRDKALIVVVTAKVLE